jgi:hypothetical protein
MTDMLHVRTYSKNNFNFFSAFFCYLDREGNTEEESDGDYLDSDVSDDSDGGDSDGDASDASDASDAGNKEVINDDEDVSIIFFVSRNNYFSLTSF